jgi:hypothetical protein
MNDSQVGIDTQGIEPEPTEDISDALYEIEDQIEKLCEKYYELCGRYPPSHKFPMQ